MLLYKCYQIDINDISLEEIKHFFCSIEHKIAVRYEPENMENTINRITKDKLKNICNLEFLVPVLLDYIFSSEDKIEKLATEAFRIGLIRLIKKDEQLVKKIRFVLLIYGNFHCYLLTGSNIKLIEKTRTDDDTEYYKLQYYNELNYERYIYRNSRWNNINNEKNHNTSELDYCRIALCYIEIIYHFTVINNLLPKHINEHLKIIYVLLLKDAVKYIKISTK